MELIRTDKNGTKYYADYTCPRCGGHGGSDAWKFTGYTCYKCGGTGRLESPRIIKVYTPEYEAKLAEKRAEKVRRADEARKAASGEYNLEFLKRNGFNEMGVTYCAVGNTYEIKDDLKAAGFKFNNFIGWHKAEYDNNFRVVEITIEECGEKNEFGEYTGFNYGASEYLNIVNENITRKNSSSNYIGNIGDRITIEVAEYKPLYTKTSPTGWTAGATVYRIIDTDGNIYIWSTTSNLHEHYWNGNDEIEANVKTITAAVKDHKEYKGEKQTVITRGKIEYDTKVVHTLKHNEYNSEAEDAFNAFMDFYEEA